MALEDEAHKLTQTIESLKATIETGVEIRDDLDRLITRSIVNRRLIVFVIALSILSITTIAGLVITAIGQSRNSDRIDQLVQVQHDSALCPLYVLFLGLDTQRMNDAARARGDDMDLRAQQFAIIQKSYEALNCDG